MHTTFASDEHASSKRSLVVFMTVNAHDKCDHCIISLVATSPCICGALQRHRVAASACTCMHAV
jgi:hypothetical protein